MHFSKIGILIDTLAYRYYMDEFDSSGMHLALKTDVENSQTALGLMFSSPALRNWATFLASFFKGNKDAESRLLREAADQMKSKVHQLCSVSSRLGSEIP